MAYLSFFLHSKCSLFHNSNLFGACIIHILYTGCAKIKKKSGARLKINLPFHLQFYSFGDNMFYTLSNVSSSKFGAPYFQSQWELPEVMPQTEDIRFCLGTYKCRSRGTWDI